MLDPLKADDVGERIIRLKQLFFYAEHYWQAKKRGTLHPDIASRKVAVRFTAKFFAQYFPDYRLPTNVHLLPIGKWIARFSRSLLQDFPILIQELTELLAQRKPEVVICAFGHDLDILSNAKKNPSQAERLFNSLEVIYEQSNACVNYIDQLGLPFRWELSKRWFSVDEQQFSGLSSSFRYFLTSREASHNILDPNSPSRLLEMSRTVKFVQYWAGTTPKILNVPKPSYLNLNSLRMQSLFARIPKELLPYYLPEYWATVSRYVYPAYLFFAHTLHTIMAGYLEYYQQQYEGKGIMQRVQFLPSPCQAFSPHKLVRTVVPFVNDLLSLLIQHAHGESLPPLMNFPRTESEEIHSTNSTIQAQRALEESHSEQNSDSQSYVPGTSKAVHRHNDEEVNLGRNGMSTGISWDRFFRPTLVAYIRLLFFFQHPKYRDYWFERWAKAMPPVQEELEYFLEDNNQENTWIKYFFPTEPQMVNGSRVPIWISDLHDLFSMDGVQIYRCMHHIEATFRTQVDATTRPILSIHEEYRQYLQSILNSMREDPDRFNLSNLLHSEDFPYDSPNEDEENALSGGNDELDKGDNGSQETTGYQLQDQEVEIASTFDDESLVDDSHSTKESDQMQLMQSATTKMDLLESLVQEEIENTREKIILGIPKHITALPFERCLRLTMFSFARGLIPLLNNATMSVSSSNSFKESISTQINISPNK